MLIRREVVQVGKLSLISDRPREKIVNRDDFANLPQICPAAVKCAQFGYLPNFRENPFIFAFARLASRFRLILPLVPIFTEKWRRGDEDGNLQ